MKNKPRIYAHIDLAIVILGLFVFLIAPSAFWISLALWALAFITGIIALILNGRIFPNTEQMLGHDPYGLDLLGYIEVYVSFVPAIVAISMIIYKYILLNRM
ncbi:hypothetical protein KAH81_05040 [bacterium]|nr:hypothetical protein [bacterium]